MTAGWKLKPRRAAAPWCAATCRDGFTMMSRIRSRAPTGRHRIFDKKTCHARESGHPTGLDSVSENKSWIPAYAGMTKKSMLALGQVQHNPIQFRAHPQLTRQPAVGPHLRREIQHG